MVILNAMMVYLIIFPRLLFNQYLGFLKSLEYCLIKHFIPELTVKGHDITILPGVTLNHNV
jgi:hypothetical protein